MGYQIFLGTGLHYYSVTYGICVASLRRKMINPDIHREQSDGELIMLTLRLKQMTPWKQTKLKSNLWWLDAGVTRLDYNKFSY